MPATERRAEVIWKGNLTGGKGEVTAASSGIFVDQAVTWAARSEQPEGKTSPEELIAAAHATCFSMALSNELDQMGHAPEVLETEAVVTFDIVDGAPTVVSSKLRVNARVPEMQEQDFQDAVDKADEGCPVSRALRGNVDLSVEAHLETPV